MASTKLNDYAARITDEVRNNILPFWIQHATDKKRRQILGALTNDLEADRTAARGALLSARVLWTYSAAHRAFGDPAYLEMAHLAHDDLIRNFWDREYEGFYWSVAADGRPLNARKQVYGQAFAIYALSEYHRASGLSEPLERAKRIYALLEKHACDRKQGGYFEAFSRSWGPIADMRLGDTDMNVPKSQNTHLHVMEAYTNLLRVWPDAGLHKAQASLVTIMLDRILTPETGHLKLFFSQDWVSQSDAVSYGHDIEAAWLFVEAAEVLQDSALLARLKPIVVRIAETTLAEGVDADGGVFNAGNPAGVTDFDKEWWPQAEAMVGFLCARQLSGDDRFLAAALKSWDFIDRHLVDRKHGEWFRGVNRQGEILPRQLKVSFWKCPYHNSRACIEAPRRLRLLADAAKHN